jgi:quercetin dioxygenase-like cupin family protein
LLPVALLRAVAPIPRVQPPLAPVIGAVALPGVGLACSSLGFGAITTFITLLFAARRWAPIWLPMSGFATAFILARVVFGHLPDRIGGAKVALIFIVIEAAGLVLIRLARWSGLAAAGARRASASMPCSSQAHWSSSAPPPSPCAFAAGRHTPPSERFHSFRKRRSAMKITRSGAQPSAKGPAEFFTGTVRVDPLFQAADPARVSGSSVAFEPGARTAWHTHPLGQTLIVTAGCGRVQRWGGPIADIRPGYVVWIPPGERHWHGAAPTTAMTHLAIQKRDAEKRVVAWMEKVGDERDHAVPLASPTP